MNRRHPVFDDDVPAKKCVGAQIIKRRMNFYVDLVRRFAVGWSPKCGCTHLKAVVLFARNGIIDHNPHGPHHRPLFLQSLPENLHEWTVMAVVRSPYERVVSGFLDKYAPNGQFRHLWEPETLTFGGFINTLVRDGTDVGRTRIERTHFEPQVNEGVATQLERVGNLVVCDVNKIDYRLIERVYSTHIPVELLMWRGPHARPSPSLTTRCAPGARAIEDVRTFEPRAVTSLDIIRPRLARLIAIFYASDLAFCASCGIVYAPPFVESS